MRAFRPTGALPLQDVKNNASDSSTGARNRGHLGYATAVLSGSEMPSGAALRNPVSRREETQRCDKQQQARRFGNRDSGKKPICLAVDAIEDIEGIGISAVPGATPEYQTPQPARSVAGAHIDGNRAFECTCCRIECVDFALDEAEIADQQVTAELAEPGRGKGETPRCGEFTTDGDKPFFEVP